MSAFELRRLFHPSDFTPGDEGAFAHALKLALAARADLDIFHAKPDSAEVDWADFPSVRRMLQRWGLVPADASKDDVHALGLGVHKVKRTADDPVAKILDYLDDHETDLIVLSTGQRRGLSRWMNPSVAEPVARQSRLVTLFVPRRTLGFVSLETGAVHLENILVPVDRTPDPRRAVEVALATAVTLACPQVRLTCLHVGDPGHLPECEIDLPPGYTLERLTTSGDVVDEILRVSEERDVDLIAMATLGRSSFLDALRGSTTEQVIRQTRCPVLAVPAVG